MGWTLIPDGGKLEIHTEFCWGNIYVKRKLEIRNVDGRITLRRILQRQVMS